jgi:hypothetical protein
LIYCRSVSDGPSVDEIEEMVAEAESARDREPTRQAPKPSTTPSKRKRAPRVILEPRPEGIEGGLLRILPSRGHRDREVSISLVVFGSLIAVSVAGAYESGSAAIVVAAICIASIVLLLVTAPTWHVRWTANGDVIVYKRNPRRPAFAGRCNELLVETSITMSKGLIAWLRFTPTGRFAYFYPLSDKDVAVLKQAAADARFARKHTG